jgi:predicted methyltransferase
MVVNVQLNAVSATAGTVPSFPAYVGAADQATTSTSRVSATTNAGTGVYTKYTHEYVDAQGNVLSTGSAATNYVRYCEYPGVRLFKKVKFDVNNNPLDEYTTEALMFYMKHHVAPNKEVGWKRLVGQEVPVTGYTDLLSIAGSSKYDAAAVGLVDQAGAAVTGGAAAAGFTTRKQVSICQGPQTPKTSQPALSLWIPLNDSAILRSQI